MNTNNTKQKNIINNLNSNSTHSKKSFWKDKKNIAIVILAFLLFCFMVAYGDSDAYKVDELTTQVNELTEKNTELNSKIEDTEKQITNLQDANQLLVNEKEQLENEKQELTTKVEELQKTSSSSANSSSTSSSNSSSSSSPSSKSASSSATPKSSSSSTTSSNSNSQMVWVGETGTKYHIQSCPTLKGKGHQITLQQAQAEGREPCKVCH